MEGGRIHCLYWRHLQCTHGSSKVPLKLSHEKKIFFMPNLRGEYYVNETGWVIVCLNGFLGTLADHFQRFIFACGTVDEFIEIMEKY